MALFRLEEIETYCNKIKSHSRIQTASLLICPEVRTKASSLGSQKASLSSHAFYLKLSPPLTPLAHGLLWLPLDTCANLQSCFPPQIFQNFFLILKSPTPIILRRWLQSYFPEKQKPSDIRSLIASHKLIPSFILAILFATFFPSTFLVLASCY